MTVRRLLIESIVRGYQPPGVEGEPLKQPNAEDQSVIVKNLIVIRYMLVTQLSRGAYDNYGLPDKLFGDTDNFVDLPEDAMMKALEKELDESYSADLFADGDDKSLKAIELQARLLRFEMS